MPPVGRPCASTSCCRCRSPPTSPSPASRRSRTSPTSSGRPRTWSASPSRPARARSPPGSSTRRPMMRAGEVLETVPGVVISQHSGEGKANQYYLRGFNLDHGTDFATTVAGMPVNMPTHGHGHGYSDLNFLIPELVSGVQFSKGPYFAEQGDFATAGRREHQLHQQPGPADRARRRRRRRASCGRWRRRRRRSGGGTLLGGLRGAAQRRPVGPARRLPQGERRGPLQPRRRGERPLGHRHGLRRPMELDRPGAAARRRQRARSTASARSTPPTAATPTATAARSTGSAPRNNASTKVSAFGIGYDLNLFSNFTYFLDDPDQRRPVRAGRPAVRLGRARSATGGSGSGAAAQSQNTVGAADPQRRHLERRAVSHRAAAAARHRPRGRRAADQRRRPTRRTRRRGRRGCGRWPACAWTATASTSRPASRPTRGTDYAGLASPKVGAVFGPFDGTEFYVNAGLGFHSNDARGATITVDPATGEPADRVTPLARAKGAEVGFRSVAHPAAADQRCAVDARASTRSWFSSATPAPPRPAGRAIATASSGPTTTRRGRG